MSRRSLSSTFNNVKTTPESKKPPFASQISPSHRRAAASVGDLPSPYKKPSEIINCTREELQVQYVLACSEITRLLNINATTRKEVEMWKRKYKECDELLDRKTAVEIVRFK